MATNSNHRLGVKRRRVAIAGNFLSHHGVTPQVCETLCAAFRREGWDVFALSDKASKSARLIDIVFSLIRHRKRYDFLIIDTFSGPGFWFAAFAAKTSSFLSKPYVLNLHGGKLPEFFKEKDSTLTAAVIRLFDPHPIFKRATPIYYQSVLMQAAKIVTPSSYLAHSMRALGFSSIEIPNPVKIEKYDFHVRSNLSPSLFWLRSFGQIYNPALAIDVLANLKKQYPTARLTMAGPDRGALEACRKKASYLGLEQSVSFPGIISKEQINKIGREHDIFINTTDADNTPVSVIEAMAMGLPIVSTNVGGIPFLIQDGVTGLLVDPDDADAMTQAILKLMNDSELARHCSENGRLKALDFDWKNVYPLWAKIAEGVMINGRID